MAIPRQALLFITVLLLVTIACADTKTPAPETWYLEVQRADPFERWRYRKEDSRYQR